MAAILYRGRWVNKQGPWELPILQPAYKINAEINIDNKSFH